MQRREWVGERDRRVRQSLLFKFERDVLEVTDGARDRRAHRSIGCLVAFLVANAFRVQRELHGKFGQSCGVLRMSANERVERLWIGCRHGEGERIEHITLVLRTSGHHGQLSFWNVLSLTATLASRLLMARRPTPRILAAVTSSGSSDSIV